MKKTWTEELKKEFLAAFVAHRDAGFNIRESFALAHGDFQRACKEAPSWNTFANWYRKAMMRPDEVEESPASDQPDQSAPPAPRLRRARKSDRSDRSDGGAPESTRSPAQPGEAAQTMPTATFGGKDYTRRLELMVRLYRTHSEDARDALCDYLLPELNEE